MLRFVLLFFIQVYPVRPDYVELSIHPVYKNTFDGFKNVLAVNQIVQVNQLLEYLSTSLELSKKVVYTLKLIATALQKQRCFLLLDNYKWSNIPEFNLPIYLRRLVPAIVSSNIHFEHNTTKIIKTTLTWIPSTLRQFNKTKKANLCSMSTNLNGLDVKLINEYCTKLDNKKFIWNSRPSNCFAQISLFPPKFFVNIWFEKINLAGEIVKLKYPGGFKYPLQSRSFHLLVTQAGLFTNQAFVFHVLSLKSNYRLYPVPYISDPIILVLRVFENLQFFGDDSNTTLTVLCILCDPIQSTYVLPETIVNLQFIKYAYPKPNDATVWLASNPGIKDKTQTFFFEQIKKCISFENFRNIDVIRQKFKLSTNKVLSGYAQIWRSIMKNHSMFISTFGICRKGIKIPSDVSRLVLHGTHIQLSSRIYTGVTPQTFSLAVKDNLNALRFVSCGRIQIKQLSFDKLVSVFDYHTWILVVVATLSAGIVAKHLQKYSDNSLQESTIKYFEILLKMLLEQDESQKTNADKNSIPVKIIFTTFAFASIVLSEAYRNDNVYKMILPRKTVALETLSQLLQENFQIFTRSSSVRFSGLRIDNISALEIELRNRGHTIYEKSSMTTIDSEVSMFDMSSRKMTPENQNDYIMRNSTKLHWKIPNLFLDLIKRNEIFIRNQSLDIFDEVVARRRMNKELTGKILDFEERFLLDHLSKCKKSAVVLPSYMIYDFTSKLKGNNISGSGQVSIGKERYFSGYQIFNLEGPVPYFVTLRLRAVQVSGIMEWWGTLVKGKILADEVRSSPKQATMSGNISVIFVVMFTGHCLSIIYFMLEFLWARCHTKT